MRMRELDRLKCIQAVVDGELKPGIAAPARDDHPASAPACPSIRAKGPLG